MANLVVNTIDENSLLQAIKSMLFHVQDRAKRKSVFKGVKTVKTSVNPFEYASAFSGFAVPHVPMVKVKVNGHIDTVRCDKLDVFDLTISSTTSDVCLVCRNKNQCSDSIRIRQVDSVPPIQLKGSYNG